MFARLLALAACLVAPAHALHFGFLSGASAFFEPIAEGFGTRCNASGVECTFLITSPIENCDCDCRREIEVQYFIDLGVDAIAMKPCYNRLPIIDEAFALGIPVVTYDTDSPNTTRIANVGTDDAFIGRTMARLLRQLRPEGGVFTIVGDAIERAEAFEDEITQYNDRKNKAPWERLEYDDYIPEKDVTSAQFLEFMEAHAIENITAFAIVKQTPMRDANWTAFVDRHRHRNITYIGVDSSDYQLDYLNRKYVDGLVGQLPYEMGTTCFDLLMEWLENGYLEDDYYPTNVVAYNLIPLELPDLEVDENLVDDLKYVGFVCFGCVLIVSAFCVGWTIKHQNHQVVKAAQPFFLFMIAGGVVLMASAIIPLSMEGDGDPDEMSKSYKVGICMSVPWLSFTGLTLTFSALFAKTWRVNRLFHSQGGFSRVQVAIQDVLAPFGVLMTCNIIVLLLWTILDPLTYTREFYDGTDYWNREFASYGSCRSNHSAAFLSPLAVVNLSAVAIACWQAFEARSIKGEFAESKYIGLTMFSLFQAFLTGIPVIIVVEDAPQAYYMVLTLMIFLLSMVLLVLIFVPKMLKLMQYAELTPVEQKKRMESSVHMSSRRVGRQSITSDEIQRTRGSNGEMFSVGAESSVSDNGIVSRHSPRIYSASRLELIANSPTFPYALVDAISDGYEDEVAGRFKESRINMLVHMSTADPTSEVGHLEDCRIDVGSFTGSPCFMVKLHSGGDVNSGKGSMQLHSRTTGNLECIFADEGVLERSSTAAVVASLIRRLGSRNVNRVGIVGTGMQARAQLPFLGAFTECREAMVWGRNHTGCDLFIKDMSNEGWTVEEAETTGELLKECEVVITATSAHGALLGKLEGSDNAVRLICCIGANAVGKQELDPQLVESAEVLLSDCVERSLMVGEFQHWSKFGDKSKVKGLSEVLTTDGQLDDGLTVVDIVGDALVDTVVSQVVHEMLAAKNQNFRTSFRDSTTPLALINGINGLNGGQNNVVLDSVAVEMNTNLTSLLSSKIQSISEVSQDDDTVDA